jgi:hypothetical protein
VTICAPDIVSFLLDFVDPRVEVLVTYNDTVSVAIPLVMSLGMLVHYAARRKQLSTNDHRAEASLQKPAVLVVSRLLGSSSRLRFSPFSTKRRRAQRHVRFVGHYNRCDDTAATRSSHALRLPPDLFVANTPHRPRQDQHTAKVHTPSATSLPSKY